MPASELIHELNGKPIRISVPSDRLVVDRVARQMQRRLAENDWRPYGSKADALQAWARLGGIRVDVLRALDLL
ncbi:hypothetical protein SynMEDNS5_00980 [Synechococcus sp. MEDNS5]|jgi:hypothetical protein|uniref:hypothetical protein n=1 Tax=Synechococcus sp. MEDNS5 TaxID=1442554 RepID=UPI000B68DAD7|nr:hypothetical protein [Synechococcus sp. MEDNS5]OUX72516.1 MAG: hypothetical protein CBC50_05850 [Synechococcus sp. TMED90]QNJ05709.1 hypothetical protein SynMEDNS5_00980 [Synechococcus sp. MEDNS5]|tara:strand:- start:102 stop:320 length:219 start_codon:yes stop_codon:yes gene_type:complete